MMKSLRSYFLEHRETEVKICPIGSGEKKREKL